MAWIAPRTWVAGEMVTAALLNAQFRDTLNATEGATAAAPEDLIVGSGVNALTRKAVESVGEWLQVLAGPVMGGAAANIYPGLIIFYNGSSCPDGWTEVTALRGRAILGLPSGGTNAGTSGTALTDLANRTITATVAHTHGVGSLATTSNGAHTHSVTSQTGTQSGRPGSNAVHNNPTSSDGAHTHTAGGSLASSGSASVDVTMPYIQYLACQAA